MNENITKLRELTDMLPAMVETRTGNVVTYATNRPDQVITGISLLNEYTIAVQRAYIPEDVTLEEHCHTEKEWLIVYEGVLSVEHSGETTLMSVGDLLYLAPGEVHTCKALKDTWVLGITVPPTAGYP